MTDVARLRKALEFCKDNPNEHNQKYWGISTSCGTTMCLGGTVVYQAGYKLQWERVNPRLSAATMAVHPETGEIVDIEDEAAALLGIDDDDVGMLFHHAQTVRDLYAAAHTITRGEIEIPVELQ
jgi:hypothetical protein